MRWLIVAVAVLMGCGSVSVEGNEGARVDAALADAAVDIDAASTDAAPRRCDPTAGVDSVFSPEGLSSPARDEDAFLTQDELTIYFSSRRDDPKRINFDIYTATRTSRDGGFEKPVALEGGVNTTGTQRRPAVSADGLSLYTTTDVGIARADRENPDAEFSELTLEGVLNIGERSESPYLLPNGRIYFQSTPTGGNPAIYSSRRTASGITVPELVKGMDIGPGGDDEMHPVITPDELTMYFGSTRSGSLDIWFTTREVISDDFGRPTRLVDDRINSSKNELPDWVSADGCVLYFTSETDSEDSNAYDIFAVSWASRDDAM
jgi:hypothetical protein